MSEDSFTQLDNNQSEWRCVALGTAASNLPLGSKILSVTPHEKLNFMDGEIADRTDTLQFQGQDQMGQPVTSSAFAGQTIDAVWVPVGLRKTPPNVRRGEQVELWQYAGNDKYYWKCQNFDENQRRLETVLWALNANPNDAQVKLSEDKCPSGTELDDYYWLEWSAHNKTITLNTSKKNGEVVEVTMQIDLRTGQFILQDDRGNFAHIDFIEFLFHLQNGMGSFLKLDKQDIELNAPQNLKATIGNNGSIVAGNTLVLNGGGSVLTLAPGGTTLKTPKFAGSS